MSVFLEGGKSENQEKIPRSMAENNYKLYPYMALGQNRAQATFVGEVSVIITAPSLLPKWHLKASQLPHS